MSDVLRILKRLTPETRAIADSMSSATLKAALNRQPAKPDARPQPTGSSDKWNRFEQIARRG
jgi:hypothetical protein